MSRKFLSILVGASMFAVAGAASAEEPTKLTADQMDGVTAAGFAFVSATGFVHKFKDVNTRIRLDKLARVHADVRIRGYLADAEAFANCNGFGCTAETLTFADADPAGINNFGIPTATSASQSLAASNGFRFCTVCK